MTEITSIEQIEAIIRNTLIKQSELDAKFVRNSLSRYGTPLNKELDEQILDSLEVNDCLLLFEVQSRDTNDDVSMTEEDDSVTYYRSFRCHCIVYGDQSTTVATKLTARLRTSKNQRSMYEQGLHFNSCSTPQKINEFLNGVMWIRNDFDIIFGCKFSFEQVDNDYNIDRIHTEFTSYEDEESHNDIVRPLPYWQTFD